MKKLFFIGLAVAVMCASCSSDDTVEVAKNSKAISFSSFVDKSVRATDIGVANLDTIGVYGWRGDDLLFNAQDVEIADNGAGTYSPLVYWEGGKTYAFEAIAPRSGKNGVTFAAAKTGGKITFVNDAETDLVYSKAADKTTPATLTSDPGTVNFTFKHLLSRVKFTFKNGFGANDAAKITVKDVKITNAYANASITPNAANAAWEVSGNNDLEVDFGKTADNIMPTANGATTQMYLIPVAQPSYAVTFTVVLDQNGVTSNYDHTATITTGMEIGKSYNFTAELNKDNISGDDTLYPINFSAEVTDWADYVGTDITVQ